MLTVGQELWFVPGGRRYARQARDVRVIKIGRKWAYLDYSNYRIDKDTLYVDGGDYISPGRCYLGKDLWEREQERSELWNALWRALHGSHKIPEGVSSADIRTAASILKLTLGE
jgi:hypothetical protein